jgi:hypothetical protein
MSKFEVGVEGSSDRCCCEAVAVQEAVMALKICKQVKSKTGQMIHTGISLRGKR